VSVIFYQSLKNGSGKGLRKVVEMAVSKKNIEWHRSIKSLSDRLHKPIFDANVAVLSAASKKDLDEIICLGDVLRDMKIVLILPDNDPDTIAKAHTLRPRFITWSNSDFKDIGNVVKRLQVLHNGHGMDENLVSG
jgi:hypothetical protein